MTTHSHDQLQNPSYLPYGNNAVKDYVRQITKQIMIEFYNLPRWAGIVSVMVIDPHDANI